MNLYPHKRLLQRSAIVALSTLITAFASAKVQPQLHFNFGKSGNVTYAIAPAEITSSTGKEKITALGEPLYYADAPSDKVLKGEGGILFNGKNDAYLLKESFAKTTDNQVIELWVKSTEIPTDTQKRSVFSNEHEGKGWSIDLVKDQWVFHSDKAYPLGSAQKGAWVHIALVKEKNKGYLLLNGQKVQDVPLTDGSPTFALASTSDKKGFFKGMMYEVRISEFTPGELNLTEDLLFQEKEIKADTAQNIEARKIFIKSLEEKGLGKEMVKNFPESKADKDWLIHKNDKPCKLYIQPSPDGLTTRFQINNGLISRTFFVGANIACISYKNLSNEAEYLRAVKPEARLKIDGQWYEIGGLKKQPEYSYLLENWIPSMELNPLSFVLSNIETSTPVKRYEWKQKNNALPADWPAKGLRTTMTFKPGPELKTLEGIEVKVHYEIYQNLPVMAKWVEVINPSDKEIILNETECEVLAVNQDQRDRIHVESDFSFALVNGNVKGSALMHFKEMPKPYQAGESTTLWKVDEEYNTWASHNQAEDGFLGFQHRNLLVSRLPMGPDTPVTKEKPFKSFVTFELLQDSDDKERKSLAHRRMYKTLAPQVTESLITGGITSNDKTTLKAFIDQMAELGLERLDVQAWVGINHDNLDPNYVALWKEIADYAGQKNIIIGGYELQVASRSRGAEVNCIHPETGKPGSLFGQSVCVASAWKDTYFPKMWEFFDKTGLKSFNMDGPYHGDPCAATTHPHHRGLNDSQWEQWKNYVEILHELQRRDIFIPIPDWYFLNGQCSTGMGYREASANLTPQQQLLLGRQYIYDGTWHKLPPMGWIGTQLVGFYTNDPRVGLEPLCENIDRYEQQLVQFLGSGCQFTIRGNRLYDTPETKAMVKKWIDWFKKHRDILTSEIIHISRPNGRDLDCMMHANPFIEEKAMVIVFNPTDRTIEKTLTLPLYYTGLKKKATIIDEQGKSRTHTLNDKEELKLKVTLKPQGTSWFVIKK